MKAQCSTKNNNKIGIQENLVATRREELLKAGFPDIAPKPHEDETSLPAVTTAKGKPSAKTIAATSNQPGKLVHLTQSRPMMPKRRLPSRKPSTVSRHSFFDNPQMTLKEKITASTGDELIGSIKDAITDAEKKYRNYYLQGTDSREEKGWFSWFRHGTTGQNRAEEFCIKVHADTIDALMKALDDFFSHPDTKFNNHSFSSYLLDALNLILKEHSLPVIPPGSDKHYDIGSWHQIRKTLVTLQVKEDFVKLEGMEYPTI